MFRTVVATTACAIVLVTQVPAARQNPPAPSVQTPVFRSGIDLIHLDVSVLDKDRRPVRGLTEADFTITDDDKPQAIVAFSAVDVPVAEPAAAPWMHRVPTEVQSNEGAGDPEGRLFVLLLDDAMIPPHPGSLKSARDVAKKFLDRVTSADRIAVVFSAGGRNQTFTSDRARLDQAIDSLDKGYATHLRGWETAVAPEPCAVTREPPGPRFDPDIPYRLASMRTLEQVADTLISAPQRRKALVLVSPGIALDTLSGSAPVQSNECVRMAMKESNTQLASGMRELVQRMQRANVTIYPIDPSGLGGFQDYVRSAALGVGELTRTVEFTPPMYDWLNANSAPTYRPRPEDLALHMSTLSLDFLRTAAENTGGLAVINTNDFDAGLDRIFVENSSYYLLGYQQPPNRPGSLHRLKVAVNRPGVIVRTRSGYAVEAPPKPSKSGEPVTVSPLNAAIAGAVPNGAFPMHVALAPVVVPGRKNPTVTIVLGLQQPPVSARTRFSVGLQTNAYSPDGRPRVVGQQHVASVVLAPNGGTDLARYDLLSEIDLPPGRYELRLSAHRSVDNVSGSLYAEVEVPDFAQAPLSVSGALVEVNPAGPSAPPGAFDRFLPVLPTSNRTFRQGDDLTVFMRLYQGGKSPLEPVTVTAQLIDRSDTKIGEDRETVGPERFYVGGRAADYKFGLAMAKLKPGPYLVTFDITRGSTTVRRSVQFTVVPPGK